MKIFKNITLLAIAIFMGYFTAPYFGFMYDKFFPNELNSGWIGGGSGLYFLRGISLSLLFFLMIFAYPWIFKTTKQMLWAIIPIILWEVAFDLDKIYVPVVIALAGFAVSYLLRFLISKFKRPNPPMVVK